MKAISMTFVMLGLVAGMPMAYAALGGPPSYARQPSTVTKVLAASAAGAANGVRVTETLLVSGTTVREYADAAGTVFAVTWRGPHMPDLRTLFGSRFGVWVQDVEAARESGAPRDAVSIAPADMVVRASGVPGAFRGLAWLPAQLPPGVNPAGLD